MPNPVRSPVPVSMPTPRLAPQPTVPSTGPVNFTAGIGTGIQLGQQQRQEEAVLTEKGAQLDQQKLSLLYQEFLRTGLQGAQAYIDETRTQMAKQYPDKAEQFEMLADKFQAQLQSVQSLWMDPKMTGDKHHEVLTGLYSSWTNQLKSVVDPTWQEKEIFKTDEKIRAQGAKGPTAAEAKLGRQQKALPGLRNKLTAWEAKEPTIADIPEVADEMKSIQKDLDKVQKEYEELIEKEGGLFRKRRLKKMEDQIKDLQERLADPEGVLVPNLREDPKEQAALEKKILDKYNKRRQEWSRERDRLSSKITALEAETGIVEEPGTVAPVKEGATPISQPEAAPAPITYSDKLRALEEAKKDPKNKDLIPQINAEIEKLRKAGVR